MGRSHFEFKQFIVYHDKCAMKVGTDGVLLGAWSTAQPDTNRILDIGTGCGLIALMLAQRCPADITGIDIDEEAIVQADENGQRTLWKDRLHFMQADALAFKTKDKFDLIVCNPPFFTHALPSPEQKRNFARHNSSLPFDRLIAAACGWLNENGRFDVILPERSADDFIQTAWEGGLNLCRKCLVFTTPDATPKRALLSFAKEKTSYPETEQLVMRDSAGEYTPEYRRLTQAYYLYF
ncbi:MAG: methyltransferase [Paraprevotella sp.]|nr:methyltransferase [Paraprevotella sp.]